MTASRTSRFAVMLTEGERADIRRFRFENHIGSEAEAARTLIRVGLNANEKGPAEAPTSPSHDQNHTRQDGGIDA